MDRCSMKMLIKDITAALTTVATKHKVAIEAGNASFNSTCGSLKLDISDLAEDGTVLSRYITAFQAHGLIYGLMPKHLGATFTFKKRDYRITGLDFGRIKTWILVDALHNGKHYKLPVDSVCTALGIPKSAQP